MSSWEGFSSYIDNLKYESLNVDSIIYEEMEMGLEEMEIQKGEISNLSSMPPVEKQELVFTLEKT